MSALNHEFLTGHFLSLWLSYRLGGSARIERACWVPGRQLVFTGFSFRSGARGPILFSAREGTIHFFVSGYPPGAWRVFLENVEWIGVLKQKNAALSSLLKLSTASAGNFSEMSLVFRQKGPLCRIYRIQGQSDLFRVTGGMTLARDYPVKLNARFVVSGRLCSRWEPSWTQRMRKTRSGGRAANLLFGGHTWTLRGEGGPIVQFSTVIPSEAGPGRGI